MGRKGDLLELIDNAPIGLRSLSGSLWKWTHHARCRLAIDEISRSVNASVTHLGFGNPLGETSDEHLHVWADPPGRWRIESDGRVDMNNGGSRWIGTTAHITENNGDGSRLDDTELGLLVHPAPHLFGVLHFEAPVEDEVAGRRCWRSTATIELGLSTARPMPLGMRLPGIDHSFWFDTETGIVLRHVGMIDNQPCSVIEFKSIAINVPNPDEIYQFKPSPDTTVVRQLDQLILTAETRGVDLTGVDRTDPDAVRRAAFDVMRPPLATPEARKETQRAKHVPIGEPPDDEDAASVSIEDAFSHFGDVADDGTTLVNVQDGEGLAEPLVQARRRVPGNPDGITTFVVDDIKFLRSDEAVVWFSLDIDGNRLGMVNGREGRALLVNDQWMIEHATVVDLIGFAGITAPPSNR